MVVRLVQGNVPQAEKFDPQLLQSGLAAYLELAELAPKEPDGAPDLIVLPETVIPLFQDRIAPRIWQQWLAVAQERNAKIIMGIPLHDRSEEHTSELQSLMRISYAVFCLKKHKQTNTITSQLPLHTN